MNTSTSLSASLLIVALGFAGCTAVAAGTAGGLIVDEGIVENDGEFDPLENTEIAKEIEEVAE